MVLLLCKMDMEQFSKFSSLRNFTDYRPELIKMMKVRMIRNQSPVLLLIQAA